MAILIVAVPATDTIKFPPCCAAGVPSVAAGTITTNNITNGK